MMIKRFKWFALALALFAGVSYGFQIDNPERAGEELGDQLRLLEAGLLNPDRHMASLIALGEGRYADALSALDGAAEKEYPWLRSYLTQLIDVTQGLVEKETERFRFYLPEDQTFLFDYAGPALEKAAKTMEEKLGFSPTEKIIVEIYPNKEDFSAASTLSLETLKRSGAIGICKFHRLMILSPQALPVGYRWMDALAHEYNHLLINELSHSQAELWLHEGTARFFDTAYRSDPPIYLSPNQKTNLLNAKEKGELVPFEKMSPSLVYLKDQEQVSLAFAQVSNAVDWLVGEKGIKKFENFLRTLARKSFDSAFKSIYKTTPEKFEQNWIQSLDATGWEKTKGALSDQVQFETKPDLDFVGASAQGKIRLGDKMRVRGLLDGAYAQYEKALELEPDNGVILLKAARAAKALKKWDQAEAHLRRAVQKNPDYVTPYLDLAGLTNGRESIGFLEEANAINPFDPRIHALWELRARDLGDQETANREGEIARGIVLRLRGSD